MPYAGNTVLRHVLIWCFGFGAVWPCLHLAGRRGILSAGPPRRQRVDAAPGAARLPRHA
jgi:hypothetical protein